VDNVVLVYTSVPADIVSGFGVGLAVWMVGYFTARILALIKRVAT